MFISGYSLPCLALASSASAAVLSAAAATSVATAVAVDSRAVQASPTVSVCTDVNFNGCVAIPFSSDSCVNFTGGLTFLDKEVSSAVIPGGFVCTLFSNLGCTSSSADDSLTLAGGSYPNFITVQGNSGVENYNDMASSFACSPL